MKPNNQEPIEDLFAFYALGTLSDDERELVEAYIESNPEAQKQLREMIETASALAYLPQPIRPRDWVAESLMHRIQAPAQRAESDPIAERRFKGWFVRSRVSTAIALLSLLIAITGASWAITRNAQIVEITAEIAELERIIDEQNEVIARITSPGVQTVEVVATEDGLQAGGRLFSDPEASSGALVVWGLTPLSPEESYQIWLIVDENPISAGLLSIEDQGRSAHLVEAGSALQAFDAIGISIEPLGGSDLPIGPIVMFGGFTE